MKYSLYLLNILLFDSIFGRLQLNLYYTDVTDKSINGDQIQHNCFSFPISDKRSHDREILVYCFGELPVKSFVQNPNQFANLTFAQLWKQGVTSEDLYRWSSASMDLIERYQFFLNQLSTENDFSLSNELFFNCTLPRFGSECQYELSAYDSSKSTFYEMFFTFYRTFDFNPADITCYIHINCNRGSSRLCLDWTDICNEQIDCTDDGIDEKYCWQLLVNECNADEYQCRNGECIPKLFYKDQQLIVDCLDMTDELSTTDSILTPTHKRYLPSMKHEDVICSFQTFSNHCLRNRREISIDKMILTKHESLNEQCWLALTCLANFSQKIHGFSSNSYHANQCIDIIQKTCPDILIYPRIPVLFSNIYFVYLKKDFQMSTNFLNIPFYICFNSSDYDIFFSNLSTIFLLNELKCLDIQSMLSQIREAHGRLLTLTILYLVVLDEFYVRIKQYHLHINYTKEICQRANMYQCQNSSKCISKSRLLDRIYDCPREDDENLNEIIRIYSFDQLTKTHIKCEQSNKYLSSILFHDKICDCRIEEDDWCEDERERLVSDRRTISFQHICDEHTDLFAKFIDGRYQTDETDCEQWECDNVYTHCNYEWNCPNGADESNCYDDKTLFNCSANHHYCVSPFTNQFICLPIRKANDGIVDCLGGTDERRLCQRNVQPESNDAYETFFCVQRNVSICLSKVRLCDGHRDCDQGDDEQFCTANQMSYPNISICSLFSLVQISSIELFFCRYSFYEKQWSLITFKLDGITYTNEIETSFNIDKSKSSLVKQSNRYRTHCHRGLILNIWSNESLRHTCMCPLCYYGNKCQYQNERVSLTLQFRTLSDSWQTLFAIVISLIDDNQQQPLIHSYEQLSYLSSVDCQAKFHFHLIYATRPKDSTKQYSIQIDIYEKISLTYRATFLFPIQFSFLPVQRLVKIINIPSSIVHRKHCSINRCVHGKCRIYANTNESKIFCQCHRGWSGRFCTIPFADNCSKESRFVGVSTNNRSICVCPVNKIGSRCLLTDPICQIEPNSTCFNQGQCFAYNNLVSRQRNFICICSKGYSGEFCQYADTKFVLSFDSNIILPEILLIHFIHVELFEDPERTTTFVNVPIIERHEIVFYWSQPFHLVFIQIDRDYYLFRLQTSFYRSEIIRKQVVSRDRCLRLDELFNSTFVQWDLLRRIKAYHLPCRSRADLSCFYDEVHLCICYNYQQKRLANCFRFDHEMSFNCSGESECENDGQCHQDSLTCAKRSRCICPPCFYGKRCQFNTNGFGLSIDAILGYYILPTKNFQSQPLIIKISFCLTILFLVIGLTNSFLSLITFQRRIVREVGCGLYLLGSSIATLLVIIVFTLKFVILLLTQMTILTDQRFLTVSCISLDFILLVCLSFNQWLNAFVAVERAFTAVRGIHFNKIKSKTTAKILLISLLVVILMSSIHDPIYRRLIKEIENENNIRRVWCIVTHRSGLRTYNYILQLCHFLIPFLLNFFSIIILIRKQIRRQKLVHPQRQPSETLRRQLVQHKHLLTAPVVLVILGIPRFILSFASECMQTTTNSWYYLLIYFVSFVPSMLTFILFITPSKFYMKQFRLSIKQMRKFWQPAI